MKQYLQDECDTQTAIAGTAYRRFMGSVEILCRRNLSQIEAAKARAIHGEAIGTLMVSLTRINELVTIPHPPASEPP